MAESIISQLEETTFYNRDRDIRLPPHSHPQQLRRMSSGIRPQNPPDFAKDYRKGDIGARMFPFPLCPISNPPAKSDNHVGKHDSARAGTTVKRMKYMQHMLPKDSLDPPKELQTQKHSNGSQKGPPPIISSNDVVHCTDAWQSHSLHATGHNHGWSNMLKPHSMLKIVSLSTNGDKAGQENGKVKQALIFAGAVRAMENPSHLRSSCTKRKFSYICDDRYSTAAQEQETTQGCTGTDAATAPSNDTVACKKTPPEILAPLHSRRSSMALFSAERCPTVVLRDKYMRKKYPCPEHRQAASAQQQKSDAPASTVQPPPPPPPPPPPESASNEEDPHAADIATDVNAQNAPDNKREPENRGAATVNTASTAPENEVPSTGPSGKGHTDPKSSEKPGGSDPSIIKKGRVGAKNGYPSILLRKSAHSILARKSTDMHLQRTVQPVAVMKGMKTGLQVDDSLIPSVWGLDKNTKRSVLGNHKIVKSLIKKKAGAGVLRPQRFAGCKAALPSQLDGTPPCKSSDNPVDRSGQKATCGKSNPYTRDGSVAETQESAAAGFLYNSQCDKGPTPLAFAGVCEFVVNRALQVSEPQKNGQQLMGYIITELQNKKKWKEKFAESNRRQEADMHSKHNYHPQPPQHGPPSSMHEAQLRDDRRGNYTAQGRHSGPHPGRSIDRRSQDLAHASGDNFRPPGHPDREPRHIEQHPLHEMDSRRDGRGFRPQQGRGNMDGRSGRGGRFEGGRFEGGRGRGRYGDVDRRHPDQGPPPENYHSHRSGPARGQDDYAHGPRDGHDHRDMRHRGWDDHNSNGGRHDGRGWDGGRGSNHIRHQNGHGRGRGHDRYPDDEYPEDRHPYDRYSHGGARHDSCDRRHSYRENGHRDGYRDGQWDMGFMDGEREYWGGGYRDGEPRGRGPGRGHHRNSGYRDQGGRFDGRQQQYEPHPPPLPYEGGRGGRGRQGGRHEGEYDHRPRHNGGDGEHRYHPDHGEGGRWGHGRGYDRPYPPGGRDSYAPGRPRGGESELPQGHHSSNSLKRPLESGPASEQKELRRA